MQKGSTAGLGEEYFSRWAIDQLTVTIEDTSPSQFTNFKRMRKENNMTE
jgi:hypothetical protein